ncbi:alpha/beta hydrolase family protein [Paenibacillus sp. IHBB 3054]|uniref:alpha/beta hydrolase family protein n=1 Tax=Paenibacillus sp. IHBB 3054 TaxID=3425689 RepID=UPI003F6738F8
MRLFEAIFIVFNVMLLIGLLLGAKKSRPMLWAAVTVSGALFLIHWLLEGLRWPLIPAYVLIVSPLLVLLWRRITGARKAGGFQGSSEATKPRLLFRVVVWLGVVCYGGISVAMPLLFPIFTFDNPEGAYGIGTVTYSWVDEAREETFAAGRGSDRELRVQIWYPADKEAQGTTSPYVPDPKVYAEAFQEVLGLPQPLFTSLEYVRTHAVEQAALSEEEASYPVLIFSHGLHGYESQNTFQVEQLVSQGYIVVGINHTYSSLASVFPDGRVALFDSQGRKGFEELQFDFMDKLNETWVKDVKFVLNELEALNGNDSDDRFTGHLDLERLGMFGHSFGGATTLQMLMDDARIKAGINMDGVLFGEKRIPVEGVGKPFLMLSADSTLAGTSVMSEDQIAAMGTTRSEAEAYYEEVYARYEPVAAGGNYWITLNNTLHLSFSDLYLISPLLEWMQGVDPRGTQRLVNELTLEFFNHYLKGQPLQLLNQETGEHEGYNLERGN